MHNPPWAPGLTHAVHPDAFTSQHSSSVGAESPALSSLDHLAVAVPRGVASIAAEWYCDVLGLEPSREEGASIELDELSLRVVQSRAESGGQAVRIVLVEPSGGKDAKIDHFLAANGGVAGVQHVALGATDIYAAAQRARNLMVAVPERCGACARRGCWSGGADLFLSYCDIWTSCLSAIPGCVLDHRPPPHPNSPKKHSQYYEARATEWGAGRGFTDAAWWERLRDHGLLVDGADVGHHLLQTFSQPLPHVFFEFIARHGDRDGFGKGNVAALYDAQVVSDVPLAAQG